MKEQLDYQNISKKLKVIHIALMTSIVMYGIIIYTLKAEWPDPSVTDQEQLMLFSILGLGSCFMGMVVNRTLLKQERVQKSNSPAQAIFNGFIVKSPDSPRFSLRNKKISRFESFCSSLLL